MPGPTFVQRLADAARRLRPRPRSRLWALLRFLAAAAGLALALCLMARLFRPDIAASQPSLKTGEWPEDVAPPVPEIDPDPAKRLRLQVDVNYEEGPAARWFPQRESPVLLPLVQQGRLPALAERTGPEPCVYRGVDGTGVHGGTWVVSGNNPESLMYRMTACTLLRWSPQGHPLVPHVAKSWEASPDWRKFTFELRKGMKWSDGHPFTARDIEYWWLHEMNCPQTGFEVPAMMKIRGKPGKVRTEGDLRVIFEFEQPHGLFPETLATAQGIGLLNAPEHYLRRYHPLLGDRKLIEDAKNALRLNTDRELYAYLKLVSNTEHPRLWPWLYRTWRSGPPFSFVRNPYFWMVDTEGNQLPYVDRILMENVSAEMAPASTASGRFPIAGSKPKEYTLLVSERHNGHYRIYRWVRADSTDAMIHVNLNRMVDPDQPATAWKHKLLNDARFRQALSLAINRQAIIRASYYGETVPCQAGPQPFSEFHNPVAYKSFTEHDPRRANQLLDAAGLTKRDYEGMRTFPDGTRMTFFLHHMPWLDPATPQFIVNDWARVGVRAIPTMQEASLFYTEKAALQHDFSMWTGENEFFPLLTPRCFLPVENEANFGLGFFQWYRRGGLYQEVSAPGCVAVPKDHPLYKALLLYEDIKATGDRRRQIELFSQILDIAAQNVWTINVCSSPMYVVTVRDDFMNVPRQVASTFTFIAPGNTGQETYSFRAPQHAQGVAEEIQKQVLEVVTEFGERKAAAPSARSAPEAGSGQAGSGSFGRAILWLLLGSLFVVILLAAFKHPFVARRILIMIPTFLIISFGVFVIIELPPGDFLTRRLAEIEMSGEPLAEERITQLRQLYHLGEPFLVRYARWMGIYWFAGFDRKDEGLLQGNLGRSMAQDGKEVSKLVGDRITLTVVLSLVTILVSWLIALPVGIYSAVRQYSWGDYVLTFLGFLGMCVPSFLLALVLMYLSKEYFGIHVDRLFSPKYALQPYWDLGKCVDLLKHIWVPVFILGLGGTAGMIRVMRANLLDELRKPYVVAARSRGVRPLKLLLKYPVRLALNPFISGIGGIFPALVSGTVLVAVVLSLPLVGPLMLEALLNKDTMLAGSMLMVTSLLGIFGVLVSDLLLLWLDPRIRMGGGTR